MATQAAALTHSDAESGVWRVIMASSVHTMIEWYDSYIFGSQAVYLSPKFYPPGNDASALIAYLSTFAVDFIVRPFGALFFGRIGDLVGRKYIFLSDDRGCGHVGGGQPAPEGNTRHPDLGRVQPGQTHLTHRRLTAQLSW
jgi:hypothetical protein